MAGLIAKCSNPSCGNVSDASNLIRLQPGAQVTLRGNVTNCPACGGTARILDGEFRMSDKPENVGREVIEILSAPKWTLDVLRDLKLLMEEVVSSEVEDPIIPLLEQDMVLGTKLRRATTGWTRDQKIALITMLMTLIGLMVTVGSATGVLGGSGDTIIINEGLAPDDLDELISEAARRVHEADTTEPSLSHPTEATAPTPDEPRQTDPKR